MYNTTTGVLSGPTTNDQRLTIGISLGHITVHNLHPVSCFVQAFAHLLGDHHGAVLTACTTEADREVALALMDVVRQQVHQQIRDTPDKFLRLRERPNVFGHARVAAGERSKLRYEVGVRKKANVED